ncbi:hypothetical protein MKJ04_22665 [Pontibacter sp. E15-1]|uniref:hypothetical protein n=1 Tax=Pontibacter sp. E15-1 TaxID=2919918 RepID=UPI001F4F8026|nr:hypothetical protein [Pontibacter sp. E15-1]MCJ8167658.1 hypothetical protein [Pontibacter sp. E15-1]
MKKNLTLLLLLVVCCVGSALAQKNSNLGYYRVSVRKITSVNPRQLGPILAAGTSFEAGQAYNVTILALNTSPYPYTPLIQAYNFDGFETGYHAYPNYNWVTSSTPDRVSKDATNNTISFDIKTFTGIDFLTDGFMRIQCYTTSPYSFHKKDSIIFP